MLRQVASNGNPHIFEWFIVPLFMYLVLFTCRDNLNILHMPLADFVAVLVVADVALWVNFKEMPDLADVALHVKSDKTPWLKRETLTA